nr:hypothetical protein [Mesorhizobium sp.]
MMIDQSRTRLSADHMPDAAEDDHVAVAHNRVLDRAIDRGERVLKYQCAGRQS